MAKKVLLKDANKNEILPITRGELILDSSGNPAFHSNEFLATESRPGLMSAEDKKRIDDLENTGPGADNKVAQVNTTTSDVYRLLFSETATDETKTEGARKSAKLTFNPSTGVLQTTALIGNLDGTYVNKLTGYNKATSIAAIEAVDSLLTALGKLELKADVAYNLINGAYDGDGTIENLAEILKVLEGISDTETIQAIVGKYLPLTGGVIKNGATRNPLTIDTTNEMGAYINFAANGTMGAYVGYNSSVGAFMEESGTALKLKNGVATLGSYIMLHAGNYNSYAPKLDGTGASGTWGINISGSAATATLADKNKTINITASEFKKAQYSGFYNVTNSTSDAPLPDGGSGGHVAIHAAWDNGTNTAGLDLIINDSTASHLYFRARVGGGGIGTWKTLLDSSNYNSYAPTLTGTGATGTWGINISGTAAHATSAAALACNSFDTASQITTAYAQWANNSGCSDVPSMGYAAVLNVGYGNYRWWQIWNSRNDHQLYWRPEKSDASGWAAVHTLLDSHNYTNYTLPIISLYDSTDKLLSTKTWSVGSTNKGDQSSQSECPTSYGMYISLQYNTSKNMGYQLFGDTWTNGRLYVRYRKAGDSNTTYNAWQSIAFTSDIPTVTNYYWANVKISASSSTSTSPTFATATMTRGVVGGYNNTSYALSTASFICNSWIRTKGSTGWYNEDYGGGWYMTDSTYIRAYNDKRVYNPNTSQYAFYTAGGMTAVGNIYAARFVVSTANAYRDNGGIILSNADIWGLNAIYTADLANSAGEGYQFKRGNDNYDSIWASNGTFYFSPNGSPDSGYSNNYVVIHSNNWTSYISIPTVTNYYWADVKISATSSTTTSPTVNSIKSSGYSLLGQCVNAGDWTGGTANSSILGSSTSTIIRSSGDDLYHYNWSNAARYKILDSNNSSVSGGGSSWGSSITVKINGTSKTLTIPSNPNTDSSVYQSSTTTSNYRPVVLGMTSTTSTSSLNTATTGQVYVSTKFYVQPSTGSFYATAFYESSDEHLKDFENDINIDFNTIKAIPKKYFRWKERPYDLQIGTSAQVVQKFYPELVSSSVDGYLSVDYSKLSVIALKGIDELYDMIMELRAENRQLREQIRQLQK